MVSAHAPDGTYRYASAAARELIGYEPAELTGTWCYDYFHPDEMPKVGGAHRSALSGAPVTLVYRLRHKNGDYVWVETTARVVTDDDGEVTEILCCTRPARQDVAQHRDEGYAACVERVSAILESEAISPVFQPIVALDSSRIVAYEALARFPGDPSHTPDRWFADAWQVDLGIELELLAARAAVTALPHLPRGVGLSINASPATVATHGFRVALGDDADRIVVEITEHQHIDDDAFQLKLAPLRAAGGKVAIDDFGSGYASLSQILAVAPDWIKLDLSLTQSLATQPVARALAAAIVGFSEEIGIGVVAEGIEDAGHVAALTSIGIRYGQGYHFGRPMRLDRLIAQTT
jgi:PAS domain S-box-containing protein